MMKSLWKHGTWLYRAWRYRMLVERPGVQFVLEHLRPGDVALDIGAHKGAFLYWMQRAVGPSGHVVAFEPQPELAKYLKARVEAAHLDHVRVVNAALSHRPGVMTLTRAGEVPSPGAKLVDHAWEEGIAGHVSFAVRVEALDRCLKKAERPVRLIKCDVEGHELEVFRGARRVLEEDRPRLLFECERRHHGGESIRPVFEFLDEIGYVGSYLGRVGPRPLDEFRPELQDDPESSEYVNNFVFEPRPAETRRLRRVA